MMFEFENEPVRAMVPYYVLGAASGAETAVMEKFAKPSEWMVSGASTDLEPAGW